MTQSPPCVCMTVGASMLLTYGRRVLQLFWGTGLVFSSLHCCHLVPHAQAIGLDVSDDEAGSSGDDEEGGGKGRKRLRNGRSSQPSAQAAAIRQQLATLLAEPLVPRMSKR